MGFDPKGGIQLAQGLRTLLFFFKLLGDSSTLAVAMAKSPLGGWSIPRSLWIACWDGLFGAAEPEIVLLMDSIVATRLGETFYFKHLVLK